MDLKSLQQEVSFSSILSSVHFLAQFFDPEKQDELTSHLRDCVKIEQGASTIIFFCTFFRAQFFPVIQEYVTISNVSRAF